MAVLEETYLTSKIVLEEDFNKISSVVENEISGVQATYKIVEKLSNDVYDVEKGLSATNTLAWGISSEVSNFISSISGQLSTVVEKVQKTSIISVNSDFEISSIGLKRDDEGLCCLNTVFSEDNDIATRWRGKKSQSYRIVNGGSTTEDKVHDIVLSTNTIYNYEIDINGTGLEKATSCRIVYWDADDTNIAGDCILNLKINKSTSTSFLPVIIISSDPNIELDTWDGDDISEFKSIDPVYYTLMMYDSRLSGLDEYLNPYKRIIHIAKKTVSEAEI